MKINKLLGFLVLTLFVINTSQAARSLIISDWGASTSDSSYVSYLGSYKKDIRNIEAVISHSDIGNQRLYINLRINNGNICESHLSPTTDTVVFNNQAVKMVRFCHKYNGVNQTYYSYTPYTDKGHEYIVNLFKKSITPIKVTVGDDTIDIPVIGFTKIWNSFGGDAI